MQRRHEARTADDRLVETIREKLACTSSDICGRIEALLKAENRIKRLASRLDCSEKQVKGCVKRMVKQINDLSSQIAQLQSSEEDYRMLELKAELERQKRESKGPRVGRNDVEIPGTVYNGEIAYHVSHPHLFQTGLHRSANRSTGRGP